MSNSKKYIVVFADKMVQSLEEKVNENIAKGYKPLGGVAVAKKPNHEPRNLSLEDDFVYVQAMLLQ